VSFKPENSKEGRQTISRQVGSTSRPHHCLILATIFVHGSLPGLNSADPAERLKMLENKTA
jgi:hypothetical protein